MSTKKFYDIHCHALNLSHPNLLLFLKRLKLHPFHIEEIYATLKQLVAVLSGRRNNRFMNLLSVMEHDMGEVFLLMEQDILCLQSEVGLKTGGNPCEKVVLTPLMMDFGRKGIENYPGIYYNTLSHKPIVDQVIDLFNGIRTYSRESEHRMLEIYPFLGLNTRNYDLESTKITVGLKDLLDKHFRSFSRETSEERQRKLFEQMGRFDGNVDTLQEYSFAGIKVYPPLGFDPWPIGDNEEMQKVRYLYEFCSTRRIPITTHCNDTGFVADGVPSDEYTSPMRWRKALEQYPDLKLNFAHFGYQEKLTWGIFPRYGWEKEVLRLIETFDNVYADFSYRGFGNSYYRSLSKMIGRHPRPDKLRQRILFGSDFVINLLATDSYKEYLKVFFGSGEIKDSEKDLFCSTNPEKFLFQ